MKSSNAGDRLRALMACDHTFGEPFIVEETDPQMMTVLGGSRFERRRCTKCGATAQKESKS